jgi:hypothetical protein
MQKLLAFLALLFLPGLAAAQHGKGYKPNPPAVRAQMHADAFARHGNRIAALVRQTAPPAEFDCVTLGWVPPIRDQGQCGSCWLVSAADCLTCCFIKGGLGKADDSFKISDQYGMDCHTDWGGCNGGDEANPIDWCKKTGFPAERWVNNGTPQNDYPAYTASESSCRLKQGTKLWQIADWGYATSDQSQRGVTVAEFKAAMYQYGVLSVALDAGGEFGSYSGQGIINSMGDSIDHAITAVGWSDAKQAIRVRNQWNVDWGDKGYGWIAYSAVPHIVEVIWVSAGVIPPKPPDPPNPPGPGGTITLSGDTKAGTYQLVPSGSEIVPAGTNAKLLELQMKIKELEDLLNPPKTKQTKEPPKVEPAPDKPAPVKKDAMIDRRPRYFLAA